MITPVTYEEAVKALAAFLDSKSGLDPDRILNADSARGTDLSEMISDSQTYSPSASSSLMLFELIEPGDGEHFATTDKKPSDMMTIQSYDLHLMIYGNSSPNDAQRISAAFKQPDNAYSLREKGLFIDGVSEITPVNEFVNNTLLLRRDLMIHVKTRQIFKNIVEDPGEFDETQSITLVVRTASNA